MTHTLVIYSPTHSEMRSYEDGELMLALHVKALKEEQGFSTTLISVPIT